MSLPFIPAWLDDAGLTPAQFRVLCHLLRRGSTYSNAATIAGVCRMKRDTVFVVLKDLEALGLIRREARPGQTTLIEPVPPNGTGEDANPSPEKGQVEDDPSPETGREVSPQTVRHPSPQTGHKGNPIKGTPKRRDTSPVLIEIPLDLSSKQFAETWGLWEQHLKEKRSKITPLSAKITLSALSAMGEQRAIAAIVYSIGKGWKSIHEQNGGSNQAPRRQQQGPTDRVGDRQGNFEVIES